MKHLKFLAFIALAIFMASCDDENTEKFNEKFTLKQSNKVTNLSKGSSSVYAAEYTYDIDYVDGTMDITASGVKFSPFMPAITFVINDVEFTYSDKGININASSIVPEVNGEAMAQYTFTKITGQITTKEEPTENVAFVASDGHKLVRCRDYSVAGAEKSAFILPKKPATLLKNLLSKDEQEEVALEFDGRFATFSMGDYELVCRLLDGRYPNYNAVIPQNNPHKLTVDRTALIGTLRRVAIFSSQVSLIKLHIEAGKIVISAQDTDFSTSAEESITCSYEGAPMNIGFRASFLIDILNNIPGQDVVIELADPSRAGVIVPAEQLENQELLMLLLPVMITD